MSEDLGTNEQLLRIIKKQANDLVSRGQRIMELEEEVKEMKKTTTLIGLENKKLEALIEAAMIERKRFLEENIHYQQELDKRKKEQEEVKIKAASL